MIWLIIRSTYSHILFLSWNAALYLNILSGNYCIVSLLLPFFLSLYTPSIIFLMWKFQRVLDIHTHSCVVATPVAWNYDRNTALLLSLLNWEVSIVKDSLTATDWNSQSKSIKLHTNIHKIHLINTVLYFLDKYIKPVAVNWMISYCQRIYYFIKQWDLCPNIACSVMKHPLRTSDLRDFQQCRFHQFLYSTVGSEQYNWWLFSGVNQASPGIGTPLGIRLHIVSDS